jgi:phage tail-like protein
MMPPASPRWWTLDAGLDWRAAQCTNLFVDVGDVLTIRRLPGRAEPMVAGAVADPGRCPAALSGDGCEGLLVLDAAHAVVMRVGPHRNEPWAAVGGQGSAARRFFAPRGLVVLPSGALAVADTGNHRISIFAPVSATLLHLIGAVDRLGAPRAGHGPLEFDAPWDITADPRGNVYVADRGNARVQCIGADGGWRRDIGVGVLQAPVRLAAGADDAVAVVDAGLRAVLVFTRERALPRMLPVKAPASVTFASDMLLVGDAHGSLHAFAVSSASGRYDLVGSAPTGLTQSILALARFGRPARLALLLEAPSGIDTADGDADGAPPLRTLWTVHPTGGCALEGTLVTNAIDSGHELHHWQRVRVQADVPRGTSVQIESATTEIADAPLATLVWSRCLLTGEANPDCLVQSVTGRYLRLRISLHSNGREAPALRRIQVSLGRTGYLEYLPAVFQEDEESRRFLERFLAIFQSGFDDLGNLVDRLGDLFDPYRVPAQHLRWLARWVGLFVHPQWSEAQLRAQIASAVQDFGGRGTPEGVRAAIRAYAQVETRIVEHFRLRALLHLSADVPLDGSGSLWSPDRTERLQLGSHSQLGRTRLTSRPEPAVEALEWGAHRFTVLFDADPYSVNAIAERVSGVVEREKPAHTEASICPVFPRLRVGIQAHLGLDASVGDISYTVLNRLATLNYDTVLGCSAHERSLEAYGTALSPRVGATTRLP